jgi:hypothetical protein
MIWMKKQRQLQGQTPRRSFNAGHKQQAFQGHKSKSIQQQLTPQQRKMIQMKRQRQLQAQAPKKPLQGKSQPRSFSAQQRPLPPNLTPEQRKHIQKMQQRFKQEVQSYLSGQEKKGHGKPQGKNHPQKKGKSHKQSQPTDAK